MAYVAPNVVQLRNKAGTLLAKIAAELALIESAFSGAIAEETTTQVFMSFETGEQTTTRVYFPYKVTVNQIRAIVMKAIAGTDAATITCGNSSGASTGGVVTIAMSSALNFEPTAATPTTNNVVLADSYYYLTTAKSTAGGKVLVSIEATRTL